MRKLSCIIILLMVSWSCKDKENTSQDDGNEELVFNYQKMPKRVAINPEATAIVKEWKEFNDLTTSFDVLYKAKNNEDLVLAIDDLIEKEGLLAKSEHPTVFDEFQIKSRQRVVKTYLLKVKANILDNRETTEPTIKMLEAYNAFRKQLNVIVNSQLDKKLILDEG
ncbi:hypothetical protein [Flagellimonas pacifica]|uniref:Uncharacterized protein n=1 Tax=Flagellimonas pacifica TaxID=1247520 RepID=A0A285MDZ1_9FLAO|nr:hypothetical protein [Allomuricauda parva]SNY95328.1 hypothetical protein SAMN06265377_0996 [Allomuricauda parva]